MRVDLCQLDVVGENLRGVEHVLWVLVVFQLLEVVLKPSVVIRGVFEQSSTSLRLLVLVYLNEVGHRNAFKLLRVPFLLGLVVLQVQHISHVAQFLLQVFIFASVDTAVEAKCWV